MAKEGYHRTTVYLHPELYAKIRELDINLSEWVNDTVRAILVRDGPGNFSNLMEKERKARKDLADIRHEIQVASIDAAVKGHKSFEEFEIERDQRRERDGLTRDIVGLNPTFFLDADMKGKKSSEFTIDELKAALEELKGVKA